MKKYISLLLLALTLVCLLSVGASAEETFTNPVANGADPFVFKDTDGTYYMYVTSGGAYGYRVYSSTNLVEWESQGYCLRRDDVYTDPEINKLNSETGATSAIYNFWAPEIIKKDDTYYMIYSAQEHLGIATSDSPLGPFKNDAESYLIPYTITGRNSEGTAISTFKCIDGHFFKDDDGQLYLYFVSVGSWDLNGDSVSKGNNIWGGPFDLETQTFASGYPKLLVKNESEYGNQSYPANGSHPAWEAQGDWAWITPNRFDGSAVAEGPEMLKNGDTYYLTFSQDSYTQAQYSVFYVTADNPMGPFDSGEKTLAFITDDQAQKDTSNPHLYGTAHHCFTTSPDGTELIMVYHAHRNGTDPNGTGGTVEERRICIDRAGFDANGFWAGSKTKGHPTATEQDVPSGGKLTRTVHLDGPFAEIPSLPTVYVANKDGNDSAEGTKDAPLKTITAACAKLANGGTIIITQQYAASGETSSDYLDIPAVNGPLMIKGEMSAVPFSFKFLSVNSDVYFDNISFWPGTLSNISVIECNFNNVVMGEGVSCIAQPTRKTFPVLVGGHWWSTNTSGVYTNFNYANNAAVTKDVANTITVLSGTWSIATEKSVKNTAQISTSAPSSTIVLGGDVKIRPAQMSAPTVVASAEGAAITFKAVAHAPKYVIYKDGEVVGYTTETEYLDTTWTPGDAAAEYSVAGYVNGACIGDASAATTLDFTADIDTDGDVDVADVIAILGQVLNGTSDATLREVLVVLKTAVK